MNLWLRLLFLLLRLRRAPPCDLLDEVAIPLRVLPTDLDALAHMNNGRYLTIMDLGRLALMYRSGLAGVARSHGWVPLVRGIEIEYLRPLRPGQGFQLHTRLVAWDRKWLYLEQRFTVADTLHARAHVRGLLRGDEGNIPTATVLAALGHGGRESPKPPPADVAGTTIETGG